MPIFRRKNCIHTASGIVALCKRLYSTPVESRVEVVCSLDNCFGPCVYLTTSSFKIGKRMSVEH